VRRQKSVRRISASDVPTSRKARRGGKALAKEHSARRADARGGGLEAKNVRVPGGALQTGELARRHRRGNAAGRDTTEGVPISSAEHRKGYARGV